jgi:hypothetical protein
MINVYRWNLATTLAECFIDTTFEQHAYGELANCTIVNRMINEYVAYFKHLLQKAESNRISQGSLFQFKKGLKC